MTRVTTRTLVLLFIAFLAVAAGSFNLRDRLTQKPVYSDGVIWRKDPARGVVVADKVEPNGPAALAGVYRGDVLVGVNVNGELDEIFKAEHVQIYIDQAKGQPGFPNSIT